MASHQEKLMTAVGQISELYQPLFGYNVKGIKPSRNCFDRLEHVKKIFDALTEKLNRPPRVLDLGCNLGFFSLYAAKWGGVVTGIDIDPRNIRVCKLLASEHPNLKINFIAAKVEDFLSTVKDDEYDLVFCFDVLHWVTPKFGFPFVQNLLKNLAEKIPTGLFELATKSEFPNNNLPVNYRDFLQGYSFIRALFYPVWIDTKNIKRPFLFASNDYVNFDNFGLLKIDERLEGFGFAKSFRCGRLVIKAAYISTQEIFDRAKCELEFLKEFNGKDGLPKLYFVSQEIDEAGLMVFFIREHIKGISLIEKIKSNDDFDSWKVIEQILRWMIFFEKHGWYQSDLHCGNFIYTEDENIVPVDYEYMKREPLVLWQPFSIRLAFLSLINSILERTVYSTVWMDCSEGRKNYLNGKWLTEFHKYISDDKYRKILKLKDDEHFFEQLYEILFSTPKISTAYTMEELEILKMEERLNDLCSAVNLNTGRINVNQNIMGALIQNMINQQQRIERLEKLLQEKLQ